MKKCLYCSEQIQDSAKKCRFCGEWIKKKIIRKVPELKISPKANQVQAEIMRRAHNVVKDVIENYDGDSNPDYDTLIYSATLDQDKIYKMELDLLREVMYDENNEMIMERWNIKWLHANPTMKKILENHVPEAIQRIEGIEMAAKIAREAPEIGERIRKNPEQYKYNYDGENLEIREKERLLKKL